jgi:hypothetical protein
VLLTPVAPPAATAPTAPPGSPPSPSELHPTLSAKAKATPAQLTPASASQRGHRDVRRCSCQPPGNLNSLGNCSRCGLQRDPKPHAERRVSEQASPSAGGAGGTPDLAAVSTDQLVAALRARRPF